MSYKTGGLGVNREVKNTGGLESKGWRTRMNNNW